MAMRSPYPARPNGQAEATMEAGRLRPTQILGQSGLAGLSESTGRFGNECEAAEMPTRVNGWGVGGGGKGE